MSKLKNILPNNHFGRQLGRSSTDALHYVVVAAKNAWQRGNMLGALFLNIKGAFPSVILERLVHNMHCRGVPREYTDLIRRKVENRSTIMALDDYTMPAMVIPRGLDQGCPLSGIAYQFYNADLIKIPDKKSGEDCIGFIDDTTITAEGRDLEEAFKKLGDTIARLGGALYWAKLMSATLHWKILG